ncbi:MAG: malonyl-CoA synthase [Beijerinckiaceae bacterium]|nr:malonyl-CoA synthase [Beijerinckiaceae bacterium]MCI0735575.1 malonyl-CoA synthase [Beijerinckiaceae bacterium]
MQNHLFQKLFHAAERREGRVVLETPPGRALTYSDLIALSGRYAGALVDLGLEPGDRVAAQVEKSAEAVMLYLGAIRAGAIFLPLNTAYTSAELEYFLADAVPKILVCDPARRENLSAIASKASVAAAETLGVDGGGSLPGRCKACAVNFADVNRAADDLAAILYTSGTTGRSKGAMLTHGNLASNAETLAAVWRFTPQDVLLHALPIYHTHGLFVAINTLLVSGGKIILMQKFDPDECLTLMPKATVIMGVPTYYTRLLRHEVLSRESTAHMRLFLSGSAPLLEETHRAFHERTGHIILERYGMTETNMNTSNPYDGERRAGTVGFPLPGIALRIADPKSGAVLEQGGTGIIEVKGPNVFRGYWRSPEKTAAEFREDGFFITGDLGKIDPDGYLHIIGRAKDLIISGGLNVYPREVEEAIDNLPGVIESAVVGLPHDDFGEAVAAVVVLEKGAPLDEQAVQASLAKRLASFKLPKRVIFAGDLPRNAMGKVQKNLLRESYSGLFLSRPGARP